MANGWHNGESCTDSNYESSSRIANVTVNRPGAKEMFAPGALFELDDAGQNRKGPRAGVAPSVDEGHVTCCCDLIDWAKSAFFGPTISRLGGCGDRHAASLPLRNVEMAMAEPNRFFARRRDLKAAFSENLCTTFMPIEMLEIEAAEWPAEIAEWSALAPRIPNAPFNADGDGLKRLRQFVADETFLFYWFDEMQESPDGCTEKRNPDFSEFSGCF